MRNRSYRILNKEEAEYKNIVAAAKIMEAMSKHNAKYVVEDVYMDMGQNWMFTTICRRGHFECQVLYPRDWINIVSAETVDELTDAVKVAMSDPYWND